MASESAFSDPSTAPKRSRRNWWKVAFFVAVVAFEFAREWAVVAAAEPARPAVSNLVFGTGDYVKAQGRWKRIDGGEKLVPTAATIECRKEWGQCAEVSVNMHGKYVYSPEIEWYDAEFTPEAVTYENDNPDCAHYSVRIDLKLKKVLAVRDRKPNPANENCAKLERRIEMQLADSYDPDDFSLDDHFVPIFWALAKIF